MWDTLKEYIQTFFNSRLMPVTVVFIILFSILVNRMFDLQIVNDDSIKEKGASNTTKERYIKATRGNIYDCNGKLLAYNKLAYNVTFSDTDAYSKMETAEKNQVIYRLIRMI